MTAVELTYNMAQFMFLLDIILIIIFITIGETTKKTQYFKRGFPFLIVGFLLIFTGTDTFFSDSIYWWFSAMLLLAGGIYILRAGINLQMARRTKKSELAE